MEKTLNYNDIPKLTSNGNYTINVPLIDFDYNINRYIEKYGLDMNPDFQRGHVWSYEQQVVFIEFLIRGGETSPIIFNHTEWQSMRSGGEMVIVDGLQRATSILKFLKDEVEIFGGYKYSQIENFYSNLDIKITINNLKTRKEILTWYIELNSGGTPHTKEEIERVKSLIE
jgi:uncharacterized protein with ParB-like and HNH nuclease domain